MDKEERVPIYVYDDYDPAEQERWLRKKEEERLKKEKENKRGYEYVDFSIEEDLLINKVLS